MFSIHKQRNQDKDKKDDAIYLKKKKMDFQRQV